MPQIFRPRSNNLTRLLLLGGSLGIACLTIMLLGIYSSPYVTGVTAIPAQPVPFSHKHHVGELGIDCRYCHTSVEQSSFAGLPDTATCMTCHSQLWTNAQVLAPVRQSFTQKRPITWARVHDLPDYVYFNHQAHVSHGVACQSCHGRIDRMPLTRQVAPLTMQWCLDCHRNPAPHLREENAITRMLPTAPGAQTRNDNKGHLLLVHYGIPTDRLTECVTCHR